MLNNKMESQTFDNPLVAGAPVEVQPDELQLSFQMQRQAAFDAVPLDPRSCPGPGVKLCMYRRWFSRPAHQVCPDPSS